MGKVKFKVSLTPPQGGGACLGSSKNGHMCGVNTEAQGSTPKHASRVLVTKGRRRSTHAAQTRTKIAGDKIYEGKIVWEKLRKILILKKIMGNIKP